MYVKVAKRNAAVQHRKQRDYPWNNISEFLQSDQTPDGTLAGMNAPIIEDIIQTRFQELLKGNIPGGTVIKDHVPNNGFHQSYVLTLDKYLAKMKQAASMYDQCDYHLDAQNHEFFGTEEYITFRQNCLVIEMNLPEFKMSFTFMLRPFIFPRQTEDLWHAGSFYVHTETNPRGWFYQMKYKPY